MIKNLSGALLLITFVVTGVLNSLAEKFIVACVVILIYTDTTIPWWHIAVLPAVNFIIYYCSKAIFLHAFKQYLENLLLDKFMKLQAKLGVE